VSPRARKYLAVIVGVLLVGLPFCGFSYWMAVLASQQGRDDADASARRAIAVVDGRIRAVVVSLDALAAKQMAACTTTNLDLLRQATFATGPVKEYSIVAPDGATLCGDHVLAFHPPEVISAATRGTDGIGIEMVRIGEQPMLRIRHMHAQHPTVAALIAPELLLAQAWSPRGTFLSHVTLTLPDGTPIVSSGQVPETDPRKLYEAVVRSADYGVIATVRLPHRNIASYEDLREMGLAATAMIAVGLFLLSLLLVRRNADDPILELSNAVADGHLIPYFQPIVDIRSGRLRSVEVLLRWRKPDGTVVPPGAFLPLLESTGLIVEATRKLMIMVRDQVGPALQNRPYMRVAFNLTAQHFADDTIVRDVRGIFQESSIRLSQVILEVTERQPLDNLTQSRAIIAALQDLGVKIALDDVGTGHSGLSYMLKLGVDVIKIDKMFIDAVGTDRNSATIIQTLIELAHNMRMEVVAEGVETFEQVLFLRDLGVRCAQGFVFAPPLSASAFLELLNAIDPPGEQGRIATLAANRRTTAADQAARQSGPALRSLKVVRN